MEAAKAGISCVELQARFLQIQQQVQLAVSTIQEPDNRRRTLMQHYGDLCNLDAVMRRAYEQAPSVDLLQLHRTFVPYTHQVGDMIRVLSRGPHQYNVHRKVKNTIYGGVYLGEVKATSERVAIKKSAIATFQSRSKLENPAEEIRIMKLIARRDPHPHVVRLIDEFKVENANEHWTVLELIGGGELFDHVSSAGAIPEPRARVLFRQICMGLQHLHALGITHLDMSLENVMLDAAGSAKIIDFGMAREVPPAGFFPPSTDRPGKLGYMAPEIFSNQAFNPIAADIYCLGVMLFIMLNATPPYTNPHAALDQRFAMIYNGRLLELLQRWNLADRVSRPAIDLIQRILRPANERPSLAQILNHPWLTGL